MVSNSQYGRINTLLSPGTVSNDPKPAPSFVKHAFGAAAGAGLFSK